MKGLKAFSVMGSKVSKGIEVLERPFSVPVGRGKLFPCCEYAPPLVQNGKIYAADVDKVNGFYRLRESSSNLSEGALIKWSVSSGQRGGVYLAPGRDVLFLSGQAWSLKRPKGLKVAEALAVLRPGQIMATYRRGWGVRGRKIGTLKYLGGERVAVEFL